MNVVTLAEAGASAIVSAMATDVWTWARSEVSDLFGHADQKRVDAENERLDALVAELVTSTERDVHNRLWGFLEARLADNPALVDKFLELTEQIYGKLDIEPPALNDDTGQQLNAAGWFVVQSGRDTRRYTQGTAHSPVNWAAMTGPAAARRLEAMRLGDAVEALAHMDPAAAVRRLSFVSPDRTAQLLSHMDAEGAASLLAKMPARQAELLARMEPSRGAAVLGMMNAEWTVARLTEMAPDRALVLLGAMGTKRTETLLEAMRQQEAGTLLAAVSKIMAGQAAARRTFGLAQQKAEEVLAEARQEAQETIEQAKMEAAKRKAAVEAEVAELREAATGEIDEVRLTPGPNGTPPDVGQADDDGSQVLRERIVDYLSAHYPEDFSVRQLRRAVGASPESAAAALRRLVAAGLVEITRGGRSPRYLATPRKMT
jgi:DNA-binding transcriptional ArsR family regulator